MAMPLSYKIEKHRDNNNKNVNMHATITLIVMAMHICRPQNSED